MSAGKKYVAACRYNAYEFRIYQLNDRTSSRKANLKKEPAEEIVTVVRYGEQLCINGNRNSYAINMDTLEDAEFEALNSYMQIPNENVLSCDNLDGTISFYDAQTGELLKNLPDGVYKNQEADAAYLIEDDMLKKYDYSRSDKSAEEAEPVYTEKIPQGCSQAYISKDNYLVGLKNDGEDSVDTLFIMDSDRKEVFSQKVTDFNGTASKDYVLYQPEGSQEYVLYNYVKNKEITKMDLGEFDWDDYINGGYLFLCSSDKGAYILDEITGEIVLKIPDASTLYTFDAPEGQPYFTALYLSDNGETRLDVYEKSELSSPIARIKGGLGMNKDGEILIYDGSETVYAYLPVSGLE